MSSDPKGAYEDLKQGKAVIIDVREKDEIRTGMIEGAQWFPLSKVEKSKEWKNDFIKATRGMDIYMYCRTRNRSGKFQNILKENFY